MVKANHVNGSVIQGDELDMKKTTALNGETLKPALVNGGSKVAPVPAKMPIHIQMGKGLTKNQVSKQPDILTDTKDMKPTTHPGSSVATSSQVSSQSSYKMAMENIIDDYG